MSLERISIQNIPNHIIKEHLERYSFASRFCKNKTVLDIACGIGYGSNIMQVYGGKKNIGVDISKKTITFAKNHYPKCDFFRMEVTKLGFCNNVFDIVCSFETIEHVKEYRKFLSEIKKILKPEGLLIISTPLKEVWSPYGNKSANPFHIKEFSQNEFILIVSNFFNIIGIYGQGFSSIKRFILYPYEALTTRILKGKKFYIDKSLQILNFGRNRSNFRIIPYKKNRITIPKYIIIICKKAKA